MKQVFDGYRYDFVSRIIGGNGYTYATIPAGSNWWTEWWRVIMNPISSHTCLGDVGYKCQKFLWHISFRTKALN
ncbi:hypothetical protein [Bartonella sp. CL100XZDX]|uniref:hypothetical protein n=1 Tax=Bartonella sp. CL100XZDX TaxID=3243515 RepID=UPI0035D022A3